MIRLKLFLLAVVVMAFSASAEPLTQDWRPSWHGKPCTDVEGGFCDTGKGFAYVKVSQAICDGKGRWISLLMNSWAKKWTATFPNRPNKGWECFQISTTETGGPPFICGFVLFYEEH